MTPKTTGLEFEQTVLSLDLKIEEMRALGLDLEPEIQKLESKRQQILDKMQAHLTPWNRIEIARRQGRPYALDYIQGAMTDFVELHGDRAYGDDASIVAGFARIEGRSICVIAQQKGKDTRENIHRNFGMPHPEGYRKAMRLMRLAERQGVPIVCLIDTPGAFPGIGAEERGQAQAIAQNIQDMSRLKVPVIAVVLGEGASGGALGIGVADRLLMFENSWYCVISPEGCAAILWGDRLKAKDVASQMRFTANDLVQMGIVDGILPEPAGGAHWNPPAAIATFREVVVKELDLLAKVPVEELRQKRLEKYLAMGVWNEGNQ
jgi:acetyl-CoA carboxylase carboxyl transferase subunit alpha